MLFLYGVKDETPFCYIPQTHLCYILPSTLVSRMTSQESDYYQYQDGGLLEWQIACTVWMVFFKPLFYADKMPNVLIDLFKSTAT